MEDIGIVYVPLVYFTAIWYILWPFWIFYNYLLYFFRFGKLYRENLAILTRTAISVSHSIQFRLILIDSDRTLILTGFTDPHLSAVSG
jgi:hypothetical protein